jgi:spore maturation protein SpmA
MNIIFFAIVAIAFVTAGVRQINWALPAGDGKSPMEILAAAVINSAESSVTLALGLIGVMALFLGLMKVAEAGGLLVIARLVRPLMQRLFPDVPPDHPAMGAMILNMSANVLGLGNAATPFGIRAMQELDKLNPVKGTASNAMVLFLAINTSSVTLLPTGVIALRAAAGSTDPAGIVPTTLFATVCSTAIAIIVAKLCQRLWLPNPNDALPADETEASITGDALDTGAAANDDLDTEGADRPYPAWLSYLVLAGILGLIPVTVLYGRQIAPWIIPGILVSLLGFGFSRRVRVYESFVEGAKDGFQVALRIIPYLVAILVAVGMFRASGAMEMLIRPLSLLTEPLGLPAEALPMALLRPLSGSGAYGILASIINDQAIGPDSYAGYLVSTLQGSTETTFYVLAVYFGAVQVRRIRHALIAGLSADVAGVIAAVFAVSLFLA